MIDKYKNDDIRFCWHCRESSEKRTMVQYYLGKAPHQKSYLCIDCLEYAYALVQHERQPEKNNWNAATQAQFADLQNQIHSLTKEVNELGERAKSAESVQSTHYKWIKEVQAFGNRINACEIAIWSTSGNDGLLTRMQKQEDFRDAQVKINNTERARLNLLCKKLDRTPFLYRSNTDTELLSVAQPKIEQNQPKDKKKDITFADIAETTNEYTRLNKKYLDTAEELMNRASEVEGLKRQIEAIKALCKTYGYTLYQDGNFDYYFRPSDSSDDYLPTVDRE